jgi:hypothetical protein
MPDSKSCTFENWWNYVQDWARIESDYENGWRFSVMVPSTEAISGLVDKTEKRKVIF